MGFLDNINLLMLAGEGPGVLFSMFWFLRCFVQRLIKTIAQFIHFLFYISSVDNEVLKKFIMIIIVFTFDKLQVVKHDSGLVRYLFFRLGILMVFLFQASVLSSHISPTPLNDPTHVSIFFHLLTVTKLKLVILKVFLVTAWQKKACTYKHITALYPKFTNCLSTRTTNWQLSFMFFPSSMNFVLWLTMYRKTYFLLV